MIVLGRATTITYYIPLRGEQIEWGALKAFRVDKEQIVLEYERPTPASPESSPKSQSTE